MKRFYSFLGAMLVGITSLYAQTNYTFSFSANEPLDSVQIRNTVSNQTKMLHGPNFAVTVLKVDKQETAIATVGNSEFLRQTANNTVVVTMGKASLLNLMLYSSNGSVVARYIKTANVGQNMFYVGASAGVYVLVATADNQTASVKLSLTGNSQVGIFEVATEKNTVVLKSDEDDFTCSEGDEIEAIGYYNEQEDIQTFVVGENDEIQIAFEFDEEIEETIRDVFSVSADKKVYFSPGNLQYQASTNTWRFAENQWDFVGTQTPDRYGNSGGTVNGSDNANISENYDGWIDLFGWGTSGYNSKNPYMTSTENSDYGDGSNNIAGTNYDWGGYNAISNGGNQAGMWRTLTYDEWDYLLVARADASSKCGIAIVNNVNGFVLLPDDWTLPTGVTFTSGTYGDYTQNNYSAEDWSKMEVNGAVFLPAAGCTIGASVEGVGSEGSYWSSSAFYDIEAFSYDYSRYGFGDDMTGLTLFQSERFDRSSVRLVGDVFWGDDDETGDDNSGETSQTESKGWGDFVTDGYVKVYADNPIEYIVRDKVVTEHTKTITYTSEEEAINAYEKFQKGDSDDEGVVKEVVIDGKKIVIYYEVDGVTPTQAFNHCDEQWGNLEWAPCFNKYGNVTDNTCTEIEDDYDF